MTAREGAPPQDSDFTGRPITLHLEDADLGDVLSTFAQVANIEILTEPSVKGSVSIKIEDKPWDEALDQLLRENGLVYSIDNGRIIVRTPEGSALSKISKSVAIEGKIDGDPVYRYVAEGKVSEPKKLSGPPPIYPEEARKEGIMGVVVLECVIDAHGRIRDIEVIRSVEGGLTEAAKEAVWQWEFKPTTLKGQPVAVKYILTVKFQLE